MKKKFSIVVILVLIFIMQLSYANAADSDIFKNITGIASDTYIVKYGTVVNVEADTSNISVSNSNIAKVKGNSIELVGTGKFNVTVSNNTYDFFSWNVYLKNGKYWTYSDVNKSEKSNVLYAKTYMSVSETSNKNALLVNEHLITTGSYKGELDGKYITTYYDKTVKKSTVSNYEYSFISDLKYDDNNNNKVPEEILVTNITLNKNEAAINENETLKLIATLTPSNATNKSISWHSSDETIAKVNKDGIVNALKPGKVNITAKSSNNKTAVCKLTINHIKEIENPIDEPIDEPIEEKVGDITFNNVTEIVKGTYVVKYGTTITASPSNITMNTSNSNIANVKDNTINIVGTGSFKITIGNDTYNFFAWNAYLKGGKYWTYSDIRKNKKAEVVSSKVYMSVSRFTSSDVLVINEHLFTTGSYKGTLDGKYITSYYNKDTNKSTVSNYIYAFSSKDDDNKNNENILVSKIILDKTQETINEKGFLQLNATVTPNNATDKTIVWTSSNESVAKVGKYGLVTALKPGNVTITAQTVNNKKAVCKIKIVAKEDLIEIPENSNPIEDTDNNENTDKLDNSLHKYSVTGKVIKKYSDSSINVSIEKISSYYVAKIWVKDPSIQIKKKEAGWGKSLKTVNSMLNSTSKAIVGCNASGFYKKGTWTPSESLIKKTNWDKTTEGYLVISNGIIRRKISGAKCNYLMGILPNGNLKYYENNPYTDVINDGVKNTVTFGPLLIKDGHKYVQPGKPRQSYSGSAKRTAIGQVDDNNYIIMVSAENVKPSDMATFGLKLDLKILYNLDGGGSSSLWFRNGVTGNGTQVKSSSRAVADALYFTSTAK